MNSIKRLYDLITDSFVNFRRDQGIRMAAAIAFLSILSAIPIMVLTLMIGSTMLDTEDIERDIVPWVQQRIGEDSAESVQQLFDRASEADVFSLMALLNMALLLYSGSTVFYELHKSMNNVWGIEQDPDEKSLWVTIEKRAISVFAVVVFGALILVMLATTGLLLAIRANIESTGGRYAITFVNIVLPMIIAFFIAVLVYKYVPDIEIGWHVVIPPAIFVAIAYVIGLGIFQFYLANSLSGSIYENFGIVMVALLWLFYSAVTLFFGAEITQVYAKDINAKVEVKQSANILDEARLPMSS